MARRDLDIQGELGWQKHIRRSKSQNRGILALSNKNDVRG